LKEMAAKGELLFPAINVNDCVTHGQLGRSVRGGLHTGRTLEGCPTPRPGRILYGGLPRISACRS